jgi:hypothetical protein
VADVTEQQADVLVAEELAAAELLRVVIMDLQGTQVTFSPQINLQAEHNLKHLHS